MTDTNQQPITGVTALGTLQGASLSKQDADNHANLIAWIEDVARGIRKQKYPGGTASMPKEERMMAEFNSYLAAIHQYTEWVSVTDDSTANIHRETHSGSINVSALMEAAVNLYAGIEGLQTFKEFNKLVGNNPDMSTSNFMNFWWDHVEYTNTETNVRIGPAFYNPNGLIHFTILFYNCSFTVDDWRTMFITSDYQSFSSIFIGKTFSYSAEAYAANGPAMEARFDKKVTDSIKSAPLGA